MSETSTHEKIMETGYNSEAWNYRHGTVWAIVFLFSLFLLGLKTLWGGVKGLFSGFFGCLRGDIMPLFAKQPADDKSQEAVPGQGTGE